jgi:anti-sigma B factor antagonist
MDIFEEQKGHITVLSLSGRLDSITSADLDKSLSEVINRGERIILVNCDKLRYISSSGLRSFLMALKQLQATQGKICLCGLNAQIQEVFDISGFNSLFTIYRSTGDALSQM